MGTTIIIAGLLFIIGLTIGGIAGRWRGKHDNKSLELEKEVDQLRSDMNQYRDEVGEHFNKTGELFNTMTQNYRDIYEHLATGAQKLSNDKTDVFQLNGFNDAPRLKDETTADTGTPQVPRDYAKHDTASTESKNSSKEEHL